MNKNMNENDKKEIKEKIQEIEKTIPEKRNPISYEELETVISKWLLIKDRGLLRIMLAAVVANKIEADPVWLFIVAAPGGSKTELIRGLNKVEGIYPISDLTPQTFLSGERGKNGSLLLRLPTGTIFTYKDFTTVLSMHRDKQQAIISQLREIFDGYYRKEFGTGETKTWEGKIGFIAGVTSVIDRHYEIYSVLGERFIQYRPVQPDSIALAKKAMANSRSGKQMREEIQNAIADYISSIQIPEEGAIISEEMQDRFAHLASFCVKARSGIIRDGYSTREIDLVPETEVPTRLAKQFITLYSVLPHVGHISETEDYDLIKKLATDSLPKKRRLVLDALIDSGEMMETADIALKIGYQTGTTRRTLEELHALGLANREHKGTGYADRWSLSEYALNLLTKAGARIPEIKEVKDSVPEMSPTTPELDADTIFNNY
jgi:DNA-binding MarR family transcriptional regulator